MQSRNLDECILCCREITIYAIGECDHPICFLCFTRLKILCEINYCTVCRSDNPIVILVKQLASFADIQHKYTLHDQKYKIIFEDKEVQKEYKKLQENNCQECEEVFPTFRNLQDHIRRKHERFFCELCIANLKLFAFEKKYYSRRDLATHKRVGDSDDTSQRGHPLCEFCDKRYMDKDDLFRHLRKDHFFCHFCDVDGKHQYYDDYEYLRSHFRAEHFLCEEDDCVHEQFTSAFRSEIDFKAHKAVHHSKNKSKAEAKQARVLDLEFSYVPSVQPRGNSSPRGGRYAQSRRRNGDENPPQVQSKQSQEVKIEKPNTDSVQEFPFLSEDSIKNVPSYPSVQVLPQQIKSSYHSTLQRKNLSSSEDFPALCPSNPVPSEGFSGTNANLNGFQQFCASMQKSKPLAHSIVNDKNSNSTAPRKGEVKNVHKPSQASNWNSSSSSKAKSTFEEEFPSLEVKKKPPTATALKSSTKNPTALAQLSSKFTAAESPSRSPEPEFEKPPSSEPKSGDHFVVIKAKSKKKKQNKVYTTPPETEAEPSKLPAFDEKDEDTEDDRQTKGKYKVHPLMVVKPKVYHESDHWYEEASFVMSSDFPPLAPAEPIKKPPGFDGPKPKGPPPGFTGSSYKPSSSNIANKTLGDIARETIRLEPKIEEPPAPKTFHPFIPPPRFKTRNDELMVKIGRLCSAQNFLIDDFKATSGKFRYNAITAETYHDKCLKIFGGKYLEIFTELLCLLPDIDKQQELFTVHDRFLGQRNGGVKWKKAQKSANQLVSCELCSQVLTLDDCQSHKAEHA